MGNLYPVALMSIHKRPSTIFFCGQPQTSPVRVFSDDRGLQIYYGSLRRDPFTLTVGFAP